MFGKNYDKEIADLYEKLKKAIELQNKNNENFDERINMIMGLIDKMQDTFLDMAKVQKSHKEAIMKLAGGEV